jgi:hypothetical protein
MGSPLHTTQAGSAAQGRMNWRITQAPWAGKQRPPRFLVGGNRRIFGVFAKVGRPSGAAARSGARVTEVGQSP